MTYKIIPDFSSVNDYQGLEMFVISKCFEIMISQAQHIKGMESMTVMDIKQLSSEVGEKLIDAMQLEQTRGS